MCLAAIVGVQMASASASKVHQPSRLRARLALVKDVKRNGRNTRLFVCNRGDTIQYVSRQAPTEGGMPNPLATGVPNS